MERRLKFYDRESVKEFYKSNFGDMLELNELRARLPKDTDVQELIQSGSLLVVWPGENKPIFPYFQFNKGRLRPQVQEVRTAISDTSNDAFYSPLMICEWFFKPTNKSKTRPVDLLKSGNDKRLMQEAEKYGRGLLPKIPA